MYGELGGLLPPAEDLHLTLPTQHIKKFSSLPKLSLGRSTSKELKPPPLIYCVANRVQVATFTAMLEVLANDCAICSRRFVGR